MKCFAGRYMVQCNFSSTPDIGKELMMQLILTTKNHRDRQDLFIGEKLNENITAGMVCRNQFDVTLWYTLKQQVSLQYKNVQL